MPISSPQGVLAVLDIDRTLFDTPAFEVTFRKHSADFGIDMQVLLRAQLQAERHGSFDSVGWVDEWLGKRFQALKLAFMARRHDFLYPDAVHLLDFLEARNVPILLMTHGSAIGQQFKIEASPRLGQYERIIIDAPNKGERLQAAWRASDQEFVVTSDSGRQLRANRVILVDDKRQNFAGLAVDMPVLGLHVVGRERKGVSDFLVDIPLHSLEEELYEAARIVGEWLNDHPLEKCGKI